MQGVKVWQDVKNLIDKDWNQVGAKSVVINRKPKIIFNHQEYNEQLVENSSFPKYTQITYPFGIDNLLYDLFCKPNSSFFNQQIATTTSTVPGDPRTIQECKQMALLCLAQFPDPPFSCVGRDEGNDLVVTITRYIQDRLLYKRLRVRISFEQKKNSLNNNELDWIMTIQVESVDNVHVGMKGCCQRCGLLAR